MNEADFDGERTMARGAFYKWGWALVVLTSLGTVWTTIVRDDSTGEQYFMIILAAGVAALASWFRPHGMARGLVGVAVMQIANGLLIATAPITATSPMGPTGALVFNAAFAGLWLAAAGLFQAEARGR